MDLSHHFLVSMPQMQDSCFRDTVVYVLDHGENGAFGVIINDALGLQFESLLKQVDITLTDESASNTAVLRGGPVDEGHGLVLHEPGHSYGTTHDFNHDVSLSSSKDVLEAISCGEGPERFLIILGHAGWAPGQLEMEVANNAWLTCKADNELLFTTPLHKRRQAVAKLIGFDLSNVVGDQGHA